MQRPVSRMKRIECRGAFFRALSESMTAVRRSGAECTANTMRQGSTARGITLSVLNPGNGASLNAPGLY